MSYTPEKSSVNVIVRVKPSTEEICTICKNNDIQISSKKDKKVYRFDHVYDMGATQEDMYNDIGIDIVKNTFAGYNCCLFAYGQTGCFSNGTLIRMFDRTTKRVEDIRIGDNILGDDFTIRIVERLCRGEEMMYEISAVEINMDNMDSAIETNSVGKNLQQLSYIVNKSHIMTLYDINKRNLDKRNLDKRNPNKQNIIDVKLSDICDNTTDKFFGLYFNKDINDISSYEIKIKRLKKSNYYGFTLNGNGRFYLANNIITHNSGKSYSMMGGENEKEGLIPRICRSLFTNQEKITNISYKIEMSYLEIYSEQIYDLLCNNSKQLEIRNHPTYGIYIDGLTKIIIENENEMRHFLTMGDKERSVSSTLMNNRSSRSHSILTVYLTKIEYDEHLNCDREIVSKLNLIDLAGSERPELSGVTGIHLNEAININLSLTNLGIVISKLAAMTVRNENANSIISGISGGINLDKADISNTTDYKEIEKSNKNIKSKSTTNTPIKTPSTSSTLIQSTPTTPTTPKTPITPVQSAFTRNTHSKSNTPITKSKLQGNNASQSTQSTQFTQPTQPASVLLRSNSFTPTNIISPPKTRISNPPNINTSKQASNTSTKTLANSVSLKTEKKDHIPFRNSSLTWFLKESLSGNSKTYMLTCINPSPDYYNESVNSLRYANNAKQIITHVSINEDPNDKIINILKNEIMILRQQLEKYPDGTDPDIIQHLKDEIELREKLLKEKDKSWELKLTESHKISKEIEDRYKHAIYVISHEKDFLQKRVEEMEQKTADQYRIVESTIAFSQKELEEAKRQTDQANKKIEEARLMAENELKESEKELQMIFERKQIELEKQKYYEASGIRQHYEQREDELKKRYDDEIISYKLQCEQRIDEIKDICKEKMDMPNNKILSLQNEILLLQNEIKNLNEKIIKLNDIHIDELKKITINYEEKIKRSSSDNIEEMRRTMNSQIEANRNLQNEISVLRKTIQQLQTKIQILEKNK